MNLSLKLVTTNVDTILVMMKSKFLNTYKKLIKKNHFIFFGIPFLSSLFSSLIFLNKFAKDKLEKKDKMNKELNETELLKLDQQKRMFKHKNDYYYLEEMLDNYIKNELDENYEIIKIIKKS